MNNNVLTTYNYKDLTNSEVQFNVTSNGTTKYYTKILTTTIDKNINESNKIFAFRVYNVYSINSENITALDLFCRFSYGTTKTLKSNCEIISDIAHTGRYYEDLELYTFVTEHDNKYQIDIFLYSNENYYKYYICPYFLLNDDDIEAFYKSGDIYSVSQFNSFKQGITQEISWKKSRKVHYGYLKIIGHLTVNGDTTVGSIKSKSVIPVNSTSDIGSSSNKFRNGYFSGDIVSTNIKTSKFVVGDNGLTPNDDTTEFPEHNVEWMQGTGYVMGDNFLPSTSDTYSLGDPSHRWHTADIKTVQADTIKLKSSNGTYYFIGVNDDGSLYAYK